MRRTGFLVALAIFIAAELVVHHPLPLGVTVFSVEELAMKLVKILLWPQATMLVPPST